MNVEPARRIYRNWISDGRRWDHYRPRAGDIVVATYPKSGTTWMQQIVSLLIFQSPEPRPISTIAPWFERRLNAPIEPLIATLEAQAHRRFVKTHLPFDGLPIYGGVRYIHVARDGRDACLSYHNHTTGFREEFLASLDRIGREDETIGCPYPRAAADASTFFRDWMSTGVSGDADGSPAFSWFNTERTYWAARGRENLLLVHYADLKADLAGEMRRVAAFLGIEVPETTWPALVKAAMFDEMRRVGDKLAPHFMKTFEGGASRFFHKGLNERWKGVLSEADLALYASRVEATLSPALAGWLAGGRLQAGDPRTAAD